ncbi:peptidoglycan DD-metalloendopeptidase family protein [Thaumasiovibrio sp. DFM-14]|uniref:peptidoglycan DD-metalloendopeptidase family protein n=1 Tax=Thaumasiovibrio sp. DFM-14 TaxID=3384792 RepID=UPI0039A2D371
MIKRSIFARAFCSGVLLCLSLPSLASQAQLDGVQQEIDRQSNQISLHQTDLSALQAELKTLDKRIAGYSQQTRTLEQQQQQTSQHISQLNKELNQLEQTQAKQRALIEELLVVQYKQGHQQPLADLLNRGTQQQRERMQTYATYLSQARIDTLEQLAATETELSLKRHQLSQQQQANQTQLTQLKEKQLALKDNQQQQRKTVSQIERTLKEGQRYLQELETNQVRLQQEAAKAAEAARRAAIKMDGLAKYKGRLDWPVSGNVVHRYNSAQTGQLKWKGMVIASPSGTEVKAVQDGKVVFADWLRGYGLLIMLDHGKDTMTLYGYNQTLLRSVGDTVKAGDPLALVGDSGGQDQSALYFQIRQKGQPINPHPWLK